MGVSFNTVSKLLLDIGDACAKYQNAAMVDLPCETLEADEIWAQRRSPLTRLRASAP